MQKSLIRKHVFLSLLIITPAGFLFKFYGGPGHDWFNNYGAGLVYEVFWILVVFFFFPKRELAARIAIWVFTVTCLLEFFQLWHPLFLEKIRSCFLGSALFGTTFVWWDFPHYAAGCMIGWWWIRMISR